MALDYAFHRDESSADGARRIADEQLERAIAELGAAASDPDLHIHAVRKRMKKLRGLLRILEGELGKKAVRLENATYRDASRRLAGARRAAAVIDAFDAVVPGAELEPDLVERLRGALVTERDRLLAEMHGENHVSEVAETLEHARGRLASWRLERDGFDLLEAGLRQSYARGLRAYRDARKRPSTEALHEWRKHAKYHFYHVRLLGHVWPAVMQARESMLEALTEELGHEHDLDDLRMMLIERPAPEELRDATARLLSAIEARREELRRTAFALGARLYAESPAAATRRFSAYFAAWQSEPPSVDDGVMRED